MEYKVRKEYNSKYQDPIILKAGDLVKLGQEESDPKWKGWIWAENGSHSGWIPLQIVEVQSDGNGKITKPYSAKELDVAKGEIVYLTEELNGWLLVRNERNEQGWIPAENASRKLNHLGRISLISAVAGLVVSEILIRSGIADGTAMEIINTGFEGATVGGLADWFAVSALFREIPIPVVRKHTNIIVKNRKKISEGAVDLVTNRWLSPDVIKEKLEDFNLSEAVLNFASKPGNIDKIKNFIRREVLGRISGSIDSPELSEFFEKFLKEQIAKVDYAKPLGTWLLNFVNSGSHNDLINKVLDIVNNSINDEDTLRAIRMKISDLIEDYKSEGFFKKVGLEVAEFLSIVDREVIMEKLVAGVNNLIREIRSSDNHPVRKKIDRNLVEFANGLISGDKSTMETAESIKSKLLANAKLGEIISDLLAKAKTSLDEQLVSNDTSLMKIISSYIDNALNEFRSSSESQKKFNAWFKDTAAELINTYHPQIGDMVRNSLNKLDDRALVGQIEDKVGNDLQFIRLNGAAIGFLAGALIKIIKLTV